MQDDLTQELTRLIEKYTTIAYDQGYSAGKADNVFPWRHIDGASRDGRTLLLGVGAMQVTGFWHSGRKAWVAHGSGRAVMPSFFMALPPLPK